MNNREEDSPTKTGTRWGRAGREVIVTDKPRTTDSFVQWTALDARGAVQGTEAIPDSDATLAGADRFAALALETLWETGERLYCRTSRATSDGVRREFLVAIPAPERPTPGVIQRLPNEYDLRG